MDEPLGTATALDAEPVPHATPLVTGTGRDVDDDGLNQADHGHLRRALQACSRHSARASRPNSG